MGLDQSSLLLAPLTDHRNQLCRLSKMPNDERASSTSTAISFCVGFQKEGTPAFQNLSPRSFSSHLDALSVP